MPKSHAALSRRHFIQGSVAIGAAVTSGASARTSSADDAEKLKLARGSVVLFQGDSITDAGRDKKDARPNHPDNLGEGYAFMLACELLRDHAASELMVYNRGISGNKVPDLAKRWTQDCIDFKPTVLSILIGVNDIWHKLNGNSSGTVSDYETGYRELLKDTQAKLPETRIVICEPFVLRCGAVTEKWFPEFDERRTVAAKLADELKLTFVPFQAMFDQASQVAPPNYWAGDGVHPSLAGHSLMAKTWRETTGI